MNTLALSAPTKTPLIRYTFHFLKQIFHPSPVHNKVWTGSGNRQLSFATQASATQAPCARYFYSGGGFNLPKILTYVLPHVMANSSPRPPG